VGVDGQVAPEEAAGPTFAPLALANGHGEATSARVLSEAIYKREVSDIIAASSPSVAHRFAAGLSKCAYPCNPPMRGGVGGPTHVYQCEVPLNVPGGQFEGSMKGGHHLYGRRVWEGVCD
jgi:hypothetical protein